MPLSQSSISAVNGLGAADGARIRRPFPLGPRSFVHLLDAASEEKLQAGSPRPIIT
jgi:hypothetical protein